MENMKQKLECVEWRLNEGRTIAPWTSAARTRAPWFSDQPGKSPPPTFNSMVSALSLFIYELITDINCNTIHFGSPNLGERGPLWGWAFVVSDGASLTSYWSH